MTHDNRTGGAYAVLENELRQVEAPTADHPDGNRPRDEKGRALDLPETEEKPAEKVKGGRSRSPAQTQDKKE
jgi:hypothetical protein